MTEQTKTSPTTTQTPKPTPKRDIRVIALDIDGTILDSQHALTPRVEQAIKAAAAKGIHIVLATGKT
ncbi:MAG: HAD hydrolase family protein, partial [Chloroflexota bacterium]